jgi:hypothetical protein
LGLTDLNGGALFNAEFGIRHRGNTVPERSGVALSFCGRQWDFQHGAVEKYNKRGKHLGEFDHITGEQTKAADSTRKIEP